VLLIVSCSLNADGRSQCLSIAAKGARYENLKWRGTVSMHMKQFVF